MIFGVVCLLSGYLYYLLVRGFDPLGLFGGLSSLAGSASILAWGGWPSLLHTAGFAFVTYGIVGRGKYLIAAFWVFTNLLFESVQGGWSPAGLQLPGTFAVQDLVASITGGILFLLVTLWERQSEISGRDRKRYYPRWLQQTALMVVMSAGFLSITASECPPGSDSDLCTDEPVPTSEPYSSKAATPVYLSYEELRGPLIIQMGRALVKAGKIYLYQDYLFVNEPNQGIHIYDNVDPDNPVSKGFIQLPGNIDIAIRDGYLYADSFIDLVVIDLNDPSAPALVKRIEDIFPYDPYQAIDTSGGVYLNSYDVTRGVVVGYTREAVL